MRRDDDCQPHANTRVHVSVRRIYVSVAQALLCKGCHGTLRKSACATNPMSQIIISEPAAVAIGLQPMVKMNLIQIGRHDFFAQFVRFDA